MGVKDLELKTFVATMPTRGVQTYFIKAQNRREAQEIAAHRFAGGLMEPVGHEILWAGKVRVVHEDKAGGE